MDVQDRPGGGRFRSGLADQGGLHGALAVRVVAEGDGQHFVSVEEFVGTPLPAFHAAHADQLRPHPSVRGSGVGVAPGVAHPTLARTDAASDNAMVNNDPRYRS
ncbi:hypothetical protein GCM10009855_10800 [Gordonia cholesterolivorans]|uniref:Uncharacterized protein n=1 Tax=Gordonia cholesterolivorans TaxID=559625 RepID=A0ABN3H9Q0_9ACTN